MKSAIRLITLAVLALLPTIVAGLTIH